MGLGKRFLFTLIIALLFCLLFFFILIAEQPCYHSGLSFTLKEDGFHILKVIPNTPASSTGLIPGMRITRVNGYDAQSLHRLSLGDLAGFLNLSSKIFIINKRMEFEDSEGTEFLFYMSPLGWKQRLSIFSPIILANFIVGFLFILAGAWLLSISREISASAHFCFFCASMGITIALSNFTSYWSISLIVLRFIGLDLGAMASCLSLLGYIRRFPSFEGEQKPYLLWISFGLLALKYLLVLTGVLSLFSPILYLIHIYAIVTLAYFTFLLFRRYKQVNVGGKRRLRWIIAGYIFGLFPYLLYVIFLLLRFKVLTSGVSLFNLTASIGLLFFPLFVGLGVIRNSLFDVDRLLNRLTVFFFLAVLVSLVYSIVSLIFFEKILSPLLYFGFMLTALVSPVAYLWLSTIVNRFLQRGRLNKGQILLEMEKELSHVFSLEDIFPILTGALVYAFDPSFVEIERVAKHVHTIEYSYGEKNKDQKKLLPMPPPIELHRKDGVEYRLILGYKLNEDVYTPEDMHLLKSAAVHIFKAIENCYLYKRLQESLANESGAQRAAILSLAKLTEYRDRETGRHLERIQIYSRLIALKFMETKTGEVYMSPDYIDALCLSSVLHDIGKVGVPDHILLKPGKLTSTEFDLVKKHTLIGGKVLEEAEALNPDRSFLAIGKLVAYHHHERWDGSGYPFGLSGDQIPLSARIVALADVYDALRSIRPYKDAYSHGDSVKIIKDGKGTQFDPSLVDIFMSIETKIALIQRE